MIQMLFFIQYKISDIIKNNLAAALNWITEHLDLHINQLEDSRS